MSNNGDIPCVGRRMMALSALWLYQRERDEADMRLAIETTGTRHVANNQGMPCVGRREMELSALWLVEES